MTKYEKHRNNRNNKRFYEDPPPGSPMEVHVAHDGDVIKAYKRLMKKMAAEGILAELEKRKYFEKPSDIKRREKNSVEYRRKKDAAKEKNNN